MDPSPQQPAQSIDYARPGTERPRTPVSALIWLAAVLAATPFVLYLMLGGGLWDEGAKAAAGGVSVVSGTAALAGLLFRRYWRAFVSLTLVLLMLTPLCVSMAPNQSHHSEDWGTLTWLLFVLPSAGLLALVASAYASLAAWLNRSWAHAGKHDMWRALLILSPLAALCSDVVAWCNSVSRWHP